MDIETVMELYKKEREYQKKCFGEYSKIPSLNFASFLNFIRTYLEKAEKEYSDVWDRNHIQILIQRNGEAVPKKEKNG